MTDQFLSKIRVAPGDFVEAGGRPVLDRHAELRALLADRAGPGAASLFAEPLISRGNDSAPPTVAWYADAPGEAVPLSRLSAAERDRAESYLADHLRPLRALAADPANADLVLGALTVYGQDDVVVVGDRPVIVNWGLMPDGRGANAAARPAHYTATLGRYLPLEAPARAERTPHVRTIPAAAPAVVTRTAYSAWLWAPLVVLLILAAATLAWLLMPGTRLFQAQTPPVVTDAATLAAQRALNDSLRARQEALEAALAGAVCRPDGQLILPGGLTPEGLTPPPPGVAPADRAQAAPDAVLPNRADRVMVPEGPEGEVALIDWIEARTVLVLARSAGGVAVGSGLVIAPGRILTNQHVIEGAEGPDGSVLVTSAALGQPQTAQILKADGPLVETGGDYALLAIPDDTLPAFAFRHANGSLKLEQVIAAGFPGDVLEMDADFAALKGGNLDAVPGMVVTDGIVNTEQQIGPETRIIMHSAPLSTGNSGGPLVDMCGRVVGMNSFVRQGQMQNRGYALPVDGILAFLAGTGVTPAEDAEPCAPLVLRPRAATDETAPADKPADN